jgi:hypothetical protein
MRVREYCSAARFTDPDGIPGPGLQRPCADLTSVYAEVRSSYYCYPCKDRREELDEERSREEPEWNACAEDNNIDSLESTNHDPPMILW